MVGFAHVTGKTYAPGRDDISQERGYNVFEFVQPWRVSSVFPEETYSSGGQLLFIQGQHMRPDLRCSFVGGARSGVSLQFLSSSLAVCEAEATARRRSNGILMLQHESHASPNGQQVIIRHRVITEMSYAGRRTAALGDGISISSKAVDEAGPATLSGQASVGCQFGGVWVAAVVQSSPGDIGCIIPAVMPGPIQLVVSDLHSRWPLPLANNTAFVVDVPHSGRLSLTLRARAIVELIMPSAGTPMVRSNTKTMDVYGKHLVPEMNLLANLCTKLTSDHHEHIDEVPGEVRLKCMVDSGAKLESTHAFTIGFNAVMIAGGPGDGSNMEAQYLLLSPPRVIATTSSTAYIGDVLTVVGDHFVEGANPLWCIMDSIMHAAIVVSSAVARCVVSQITMLRGIQVHAPNLHQSSAPYQMKVGMKSGETVQGSLNLVPITLLPQPPEVVSLVPNVGFSHGGAQVSIFPEKGGVGASRLRSSTYCQFGTIVPVSSSFVSADAISCTSPALRPGVVPVGAPAPQMFDNTVGFRVLNAPSFLLTASKTVVLSREGVTEFLISSLPHSSQVKFGCVLPGLHETPVHAYTGARGYSSCSLPMLQPGFSTFDISVFHYGTELGAMVPSQGVSQVYQNVEIQISPPAPAVFVQHHRHSGEMYPGDPLFIVADIGGFSGGFLCMMTTGSSNSEGVKSKVMLATIVSSAVALCEVPFLHSPHEASLLLDATLSLCASSVCSGNDVLASTHHKAHLAIRAGNKLVVGVSPTQGSSAGGTPVRIRHHGPSLDSSRQHSVCRMGSIGPIVASAAFSGDTVELDCISPAHMPGVVAVALSEGAGWVDDAALTFTFVEALDDDANSSMVADDVLKGEDDPTFIKNASSTSKSCDDEVILMGDILDVTPTWGTSEGGIEITLHVMSMSHSAVGECRTWKASCRVGTIWPVAGYHSQQGLTCITPAHAPGIVDVSAPKMVSGSGQPFVFQNTALQSTAIDEESIIASNTVVQVKSSPRAGEPGTVVDVAAAEMMNKPSACVFASPVRASAPWIFATNAHVVSSVVLRCEAPAGFVPFGISVVEQSQIVSSVPSTMMYSAYHEAPLCGVLGLTPSTGYARGGSIARATLSCRLGGTLTSIDARLGCRFGSIGPIAASMRESGVHDIECVAPAHAPGKAPFAMTTNWRDVSFDPFTSDPGQFRRFLFKSDETKPHTADLELPPPIHEAQNSLPLMSNVVPWLVGGGSVLHITGRELPNNFNAACLVGSSIVSAHPVSSALVLCDPFPMSTPERSIATANLAGGMTEISLSVTSSNSLSPDRPTGSEAAPLTMFVISAAPVVGVDVIDGWEQGGGQVTFELGGWAPTGYLDCHFGTVAVHGREGGGAGWQSRAAMGRVGEWWSEATVVTDVECVTPARRAGIVPLGISLAHSTSASFGEHVQYKYL